MEAQVATWRQEVAEAERPVRAQGRLGEPLVVTSPRSRTLPDAARES
jgi:hypothetical protein